MKGIGCKSLSLVLKELKDEISIFQINDMSFTQDSSLKEALIKFPNAILINWSTLTHRVLYDINATFQKLWMNSLLRLITMSRKSSKKGMSTTRILLQKGLELKAKLQNQNIVIKMSSFDMRKVGEEFKLQVPDLVLDVVGQCENLFKLESVSVQKSLTNPLAGKFRMDIDGLVDKDNTAVVLSMALLEFNFPHEMDVYDVISNELLAVVKWLRILHGLTGTNFDNVHPDLLIFIRKVNIEFQVLSQLLKVVLSNVCFDCQLFV